MKRILAVTLVFAIGTGLFCGLRTSTLQLRAWATERGQILTVQTQLLARTTTELTALKQSVNEAAQKLEGRPQILLPSLAGKFADLVSGKAHLSPAESEQLLADLGFNWASGGDYVIVSKETLHAISLDGMRGRKLNDAACAVLAITPEERSSIESVTQGLNEEYKFWAEAHLQRQEPAGDVVANYTLPADAEFSQSISNKFTGAVLATLGNERGNLLLDYASSWMVDVGLCGGGETTITIKRYQSGDEPRLTFVLKRAGSVMSTDVSPYQPFPEAFLPICPGGWPELAAREHFELPKAYYR